MSSILAKKGHHSDLMVRIYFCFIVMIMISSQLFMTEEEASAAEAIFPCLEEGKRRGESRR